MKKILPVFGFCMLLFSFSAISQDTKEDEKICPEFSNFKGTLLILENHDFRDNTLNRMTEKRFKSNYEGEYEVITEEDLLSKPYNDKTKYRFTVQLRNARLNDHSGGTDLTKFVMIDRLTDKQYETRTYTNWVTAMNQYTKALEKARSK